ncbi:MAG: hypothetical protein E6I80_07295 [Chloroflexi bacterium]|nr:MAG: hypothetical protein E6I80_07295 [Chloroflexota bacterium]
MFGDLVELVLQLLLAEGVEHRLAVVRQERLHKDGVRHAISNLTSHYARIEVPHDNDISQIAGGEDPEHISDMGRQSDLRNISLLGQSGQRDLLDVMTQRA